MLMEPLDRVKSLEPPSPPRRARNTVPIPPLASSAMSSNRSSFVSIISGTARGSKLDANAKSRASFDPDRSLGLPQNTWSAHGPSLARCRRLEPTFPSRAGWRLVSFARRPFSLGCFPASSYQGCNVYDASLLLPGDAGALSGLLDGGACVPVVPPSRPLLGNPDAEAQDLVDCRGLQFDRHRRRGRRRGDPVRLRSRRRLHMPWPLRAALEKTRRTRAATTRAGSTTTRSFFFSRSGLPLRPGHFVSTRGLQSGQYGLLIVISGYNQQLNDDSVEVDFYVSERAQSHQ